MPDVIEEIRKNEQAFNLSSYFREKISKGLGYAL